MCWGQKWALTPSFLLHKAWYFPGSYFNHVVWINTWVLEGQEALVLLWEGHGTPFFRGAGGRTLGSQWSFYCKSYEVAKACGKMQGWGRVRGDGWVRAQRCTMPSPATNPLFRNRNEEFLRPFAHKLKDGYSMKTLIISSHLACLKVEHLIWTMNWKPVSGRGASLLRTPHVLNSVPEDPPSIPLEWRLLLAPSCIQLRETYTLTLSLPAGPHIY